MAIPFWRYGSLLHRTRRAFADRLRLRIAEAAVELEHARPLRREHQPGEQRAHERSAPAVQLGQCRGNLRIAPAAASGGSSDCCLVRDRFKCCRAGAGTLAERSNSRSRPGYAGAQGLLRISRRAHESNRKTRDRGDARPERPQHLFVREKIRLSGRSRITRHSGGTREEVDLSDVRTRLPVER